MIATEHDTLLTHIRTERGPIRFEDLLCDCAAMKHAPTFPKDEAELKRQLAALVKAGLATWVDGVVEYVPVAESDPQRTLFGG